MEEKKKIKDAFDKVRKAINRAKSINDKPFIPRREIVDVQDCEFWNEGHCDCYEIYGFAHCSKVNNCYFKQLIRCKRSLVDTYIKSNIRQQAYKRMKKENEKLKIKLMKKSEVDTFFNTPIEGWDSDPCKICRHKQTLDEIENYVRDNSDFDKSDKLTSNTGAYDILEIISKAKDNKQ